MATGRPLAERPRGRGDSPPLPRCQVCRGSWVRDRDQVSNLTRLLPASEDRQGVLCGVWSTGPRHWDWAWSQGSPDPRVPVWGGCEEGLLVAVCPLPPPTLSAPRPPLLGPCPWPATATWSLSKSHPTEGPGSPSVTTAEPGLALSFGRRARWGPGTTELGVVGGLPALGTTPWPLRIRTHPFMLRPHTSESGEGTE